MVTTLKLNYILKINIMFSKSKLLVFLIAIVCFQIIALVMYSLFSEKYFVQLFAVSIVLGLLINKSKFSKNEK